LGQVWADTREALVWEAVHLIHSEGLVMETSFEVDDERNMRIEHDQHVRYYGSELTSAECEA
jgi:hypothetical protein